MSLPSRDAMSRSTVGATSWAALPASTAPKNSSRPLRTQGCGSSTSCASRLRARRNRRTGRSLRARMSPCGGEATVVAGRASLGLPAALRAHPPKFQAVRSGLASAPPGRTSRSNTRDVPRRARRQRRTKDAQPNHGARDPPRVGASLGWKGMGVGLPALDLRTATPARCRTGASASRRVVPCWWQS